MRKKTNIQKKITRILLFSGSKEAGEKLMSMLKLGASKPWKEVIEVMTGKPEMDTAAFREYFLPLENWLKEENARNGVPVGWRVKNEDDLCKKSGNGNAADNIRPAFTAMTIILSAIVMWVK